MSCPDDCFCNPSGAERATSRRVTLRRALEASAYPLLAIACVGLALLMTRMIS